MSYQPQSPPLAGSPHGPLWIQTALLLLLIKPFQFQPFWLLSPSQGAHSGWQHFLAQAPSWISSPRLDAEQHVRLLTQPMPSHQPHYCTRLAQPEEFQRRQHHLQLGTAFSVMLISQKCMYRDCSKYIPCDSSRRILINVMSSPATSSFRCSSAISVVQEVARGEATCVQS